MTFTVFPQGKKAVLFYLTKCRFFKFCVFNCRAMRTLCAASTV